MRHFLRQLIVIGILLCSLDDLMCPAAEPITTDGKPAVLEISPAGNHAVRITLRPLEVELPETPVLAKEAKAEPVISLKEIDESVEIEIHSLQVSMKPDPLTVSVTRPDDTLIQQVTFEENGRLAFCTGDAPILGLGEGGPLPQGNWREAEVEFDRRGRLHRMRPRWQANAYGSRNPVPLLIGTEGWAMLVATPWGEVDLRQEESGSFQPWEPPSPPEEDGRRARSRYVARTQGRPPVDSIVDGVYDVFVFDARDPSQLMEDIAIIAGNPVMPPKWSLGYMQSHRTLEDDQQMVEIVDTFREKQIPLDAVIYLGTGFCPRGWNTEQPSFQFNPEVFQREPAEVIEELHDRHVKVVVHIVPWRRNRLPTLRGNIPPKEGETVDRGHILDYWQQHEPLFAAGIDAFWPDEGDWFNLFERINRHQLYHQGPLSSRPNSRPWSLHRNGHLGIAKWGGWVWSGDTESAWKTLEAQIAVGLNHSMSLSPYWGSDIGGFYPNEELTGELYARWFQFGAFCPSFRSHGRTWWLWLPWGWGLSERGPLESNSNPLESELNNPRIEPVCKKYAELRYQLMPYTYTLAREAHDSGMPMMRSLWLLYPQDAKSKAVADQYLWGRDLLIAPVYTPDAETREVYLPPGTWYDWWTSERHEGGTTITRSVDLSTMPIFV